MIKVRGLDQIPEFRKQLQLEMARLDREISMAFYRWTMSLFTELVQGTAQWSGNLASNWNYSLGEPDFLYVQNPNKTGDDPHIDYQQEGMRFGVFFAGADPAVAETLARAELSAIPTWRDVVYFANPTPDDQGGYLEENIEAGKVRLRPVNLVGGQAITLSTIITKANQGGQL